MVVACRFRLPLELDLYKTIDVITESEFNRRVFNSLVQLYQEDIEWSFTTIEQMGKLVGESDLPSLEKTLESFSSVYLIGIGYVGRDNKYYDNPATSRDYYTLKGSRKEIDFYGYLDRIINLLQSP